MMKLNLCVVSPFNRPVDDAALVIFRSITPAVPAENADAFLEGCARYARKHKVTLISCMFEFEDYLNVAVIAPDGTVMGVSRATHLRLDAGKNLIPFDDAQIIGTPFGKLYVAVDVDIYSPETLRLAVLGGCDFIIAQQYFNEIDFHISRLMMGAWSQAVSNQIHIVSVTNRSTGIFAPLEITASKDGLLLFDENSSDFFASFAVERTVGARNTFFEELKTSAFALKYLTALSK